MRCTLPGFCQLIIKKSKPIYDREFNEWVCVCHLFGMGEYVIPIKYIKYN